MLATGDSEPLHILCLFALSVMLLMVMSFSLATADEPIDDLGDTFNVLIPLSGLAASIALRDWDGAKQCCYSIGTGQIVTEILKYTVDQDRPNGDSKSFPSGHASSAFGGATFIQQRYGWRYALPAYLGAVYTGWSRVELDRHYPHDVVAGAVIGILSSYLFTTPYDEHRSVQLFYEENTIGCLKNWTW